MWRETEHVRLELGPYVFHRHRLNGAGLAVAGVVDERADRARLGFDSVHGLGHRLLVGDVEGDRPAALGLEVGDRRQLRALAST